MLLRISKFPEIHLMADHTSAIRVNELPFMRVGNTVRRSENKERFDGVLVLHHRFPFSMRKLLVRIFTTLLGIINCHKLRLQ
jgi:hypothetical protein